MPDFFFFLSHYLSLSEVTHDHWWRERLYLVSTATYLEKLLYWNLPWQTKHFLLMPPSIKNNLTDKTRLDFHKIFTRNGTHLSATSVITAVIHLWNKTAGVTEQDGATTLSCWMKSCRWQAMHLQLLSEVRLLFADASPCAEWNRSKVSHRVFETDLLLTTSLSGYTCETFWLVLIYCNAVKERNACSISPIFTLKIINHLTEHLLSSFITVTVLFLKTIALLCH